MYTYSQASGHLFRYDVFIAAGYSGFGEGKNNPGAESLHSIGPIPRGTYTIGPGAHHPRLGPMALPLTPDPANEMCGRSEFFIHGDSLQHAGAASHGCIILPYGERLAISQSGDHTLIVTE